MTLQIVVDQMLVEVIESDDVVDVLLDQKVMEVYVDPAPTIIEVPGIMGPPGPQGPIGPTGTLVLQNLTSDPVDPAVGEIWLRIDL